jgi:SAM-dependent methyltransferase
MNLSRQSEYWDSQVRDFDSIYSHGKSRLRNWIDTTFRWDMYKRFEYTLAHAEPIRGRTFLDVGCGTGRYALELARRGARRVVGIDISGKMVETCRERAHAGNLQDVCSFVQADLLTYQPDARFDVCIGIGLFDYIKDARPVLAKMREVVTDCAIVSLPRLWTWRAAVRKVRLALKGCDVFFYSKGRMDILLKEAGFARYTYEQIGQLYCVTASV